MVPVPNRAHLFVRIVLYDTVKQQMSTLHVIDLAGSHSLDHQAFGQRYQEQLAINQELLGLGKFMSELARLSTSQSELPCQCHVSLAVCFLLLWPCQVCSIEVGMVFLMRSVMHPWQYCMCQCRSYCAWFMSKHAADMTLYQQPALKGMLSDGLCITTAFLGIGQCRLKPQN